MSVLELSDADDFYTGFIDALLWSSIDHNEEPLDENYSEADIDDDTREVIKSACVLFIARSRLSEEDLTSGLGEYTLASKAGHDFALTSNDHGTGFWAGDYLEVVGNRLTKLSKSLGPFEIYPADNGKLYL